jgi:hypothetical protein
MEVKPPWAGWNVQQRLGPLDVCLGEQACMLPSPINACLFKIWPWVTILGGWTPPRLPVLCTCTSPGPADPPPSEYWYCFDLVRIEFSSRLPQELCQTIKCCLGNGLQTFGKKGFQHFYQKHNFYDGFGRERLGQNDRHDHGIIPDFHQKSDFDSCFANQSRCFPENLHFHFLCLNDWFLFGGQICEAFIFLE